jgi:hypothetical protein
VANERNHSAPIRVSPSQSPADAVERILPRHTLRLIAGDVVVCRELVPRVNPNPIAKEPQWRYRVLVYRGPDTPGRVFSSFVHAAHAAEELATAQRGRIMFVEDDVPSLLADYRRTP